MRAKVAPWLVAALALAALFTCYLRLSATLPVDSDGASVALQAWDMLHGNVLLTGWQVADVSFYTTELPQFSLIEAGRGLRPDVIYIASAMTYTLVVLLVAVLARGGARGAAGLARALLAAGVIVAPDLGHGITTVLRSPNHAGTGVPILAIFVLVDRLKPRWWVPLLITVGLVWVQVADSAATAAAAGPLGLVCLLRVIAAAVRRRHRVGIGPDAAPPLRTRLAGAWYDLALAAGAAASVPLARLAVSAIAAGGGWSGQPLPGKFFSNWGAFGSTAVAVGQSILVFFGADVFAASPGLSYAIAVAHMIGVALAAVALGTALWRLGRDRDRITQTLIAGVFAMLAAGLFTNYVPSVLQAHEIVVLLPLAAALTGRVLGDWLAAQRLRWQAAVLVLSCFLAGLGWAAVDRPPAPDPYQTVTAWLGQHGLTSGLAQYWQSAAVTLSSQQQSPKLKIIPISEGILGFHAYLWEGKPQWYDPTARSANFYLTGPESVGGQDDEVLSAQAFFGAPEHTYHVAGYAILVWNSNLLARLVTGLSSPSADGCWNSCWFSWRRGDYSCRCLARVT